MPARYGTLRPHLRKDIHHLEMVQRRAARFIKRDYSYESSVTQMLKDLDLLSLENRRKINKLTVLGSACMKKIKIKMLTLESSFCSTAGSGSAAMPMAMPNESCHCVS